MAYCKSCGKFTVWIQQENGKWLMFNSSIDGGQVHYKTCKPDPEYIQKRDKIIKSAHRPDPIQIGEGEFIK